MKTPTKNYEETNVTQKRRQAISPVCDDSISSPQGNTILPENSSESLNSTPTNTNTNTNLPNAVDQNTLHHINTLIQQNLRQNNESILLAIRTTIQKEIENALKDLTMKMEQNTDHIQTKHAAIEENIHSLEQKIKLLYLSVPNYSKKMLQ